jgi:predicted AAA+ superfamily ATPase
MNITFQPHNTHLEDPRLFAERDPHLRQLRDQLLVHRSSLLDRLPRNETGIFSIAGGRQIGKTTLLKQWMAELLGKGVPPTCLRFITGELIDDHHTLVRLLTDLVAAMPADPFKYILLDEVTYIREWDKGIKYLADAGLLEGVALIITGSDLLVIQEARMRFPGRRGHAPEVDFHLQPLSFAEVCRLKQCFSPGDFEALSSGSVPLDPGSEEILQDEFAAYLVHGGFLTAINDRAREGRILPATFATYSDWIRGDMLKRGKQEHYLREVLAALVKRYGTQVTWNALARDLSIDHPATVADYIALLTSMDAVFVQAALLEDKLVGAPKKARKVGFADPFIFHAIAHWLNPVTDPYANQVVPLLQDTERSGALVEACAAAHYGRHYPTYYIKGEGEIDIAYVAENRFWPVEVKWTGQLRPKSLKQASKYPNSRILARQSQPRQIMGIEVEFLPLALLQLDGAQKR